jgi:UDP-N-acetylglucosamine 2-epimerase (non-hydrolysing)
VKKILFVFGTRPEAIKMAPLIHAFQQRGTFRVEICLTGQHREMLEQVLSFFSIKADYDLQLMQPGQDLSSLTARAIMGLHSVMQQAHPDFVLVQGDTTSAYVGALVSFYHQIPVGHVEAGLRSGQKYSPFPEELNRKMAGIIADFHFAPTSQAAQNLRLENITENVFVTGNTVIDALQWGLQKVRTEPVWGEPFSSLLGDQRLVLITGHRRESFGNGFEQICQAIARLSNAFPDVKWVYPVHLNPEVQRPVNTILSNLPNVHLIKPVDYPEMIWLIDRCELVLTDSGGIQEEAPSLGKPVLVMRSVTERMEGVHAGTARLVGSDSEIIFKETYRLLNDKQAYDEMARAVNPYGDGQSAIRIMEIIEHHL